MNASFLVGHKPTGDFNFSVANPEQEKCLQILRWGYITQDRLHQQCRNSKTGSFYWEKLSKTDINNYFHMNFTQYYADLLEPELLSSAI